MHENLGISIIISAHNAEKNLIETLELLLKENCKDWQAIVVDDDCTDTTGAITSKYTAINSRILAISRENNTINPATNKTISVSLDDFFLALEKQSKSPYLSFRVRRKLELLILSCFPNNFPATIGFTHAVLIEITQNIEDILPPDQCDRLHCRIEMSGNFLGNLELPIIQGKVSSWVLKDAIAAEFADLILPKYFADNLYKKTPQKPNLYNQLDYIFLQQIWGLEDWPNERFYNPDYSITAPEIKPIKSDFITLEISDNIPDFQVKYSSITAIVTAGGVPFISVKVTAENNLVTAQKLRGNINLLAGFELLCRVCVREALLGQPLTNAIPLRKRLAEKAKNYQPQFPDNSLVLGCRLGKIDTSISCRAILPIATVKDLLQMAKVAKEPVIKIATPQQIVYAPDVIFPPKKTKNQQNIITRLQKFINSFFIKHTQKSLVARSVGNWDNGITEKLPILKYSQVNKANFDEQLCYLRDNGFYSISAAEFLDSMIAKCPLPAGAIWITFDQGYLDFYQNAWPLLKKYGFTATVFIATDQVGSVNEEKIPLLGWKEIKQLQNAGVEFGSMGVSYRHLTALSTAEIVQEAARSRTILTQKLGVSIHTFAYPFGDYDPIVAHLIGACGYTLGLTNDDRLTTFNDKLLAQPRIEVTSNDHIAEILAKYNFSVNT